MRTESQKKAQKKYDQKSKVVSIKYTPSQMEEYEKLQKHLKAIRVSQNEFIKYLVRAFLDGQLVPRWTMTGKTNKYIEPVKELDKIFDVDEYRQKYGKKFDYEFRSYLEDLEEEIYQRLSSWDYELELELDGEDEEEQKQIKKDYLESLFQYLP